MPQGQDMGDIGSVFEAFFGGGGRFRGRRRGAPPDAWSDFGGDREATIEFTIRARGHSDTQCILLE